MAVSELAPQAKPSTTHPPTVVVDGLHVIYKVYVSGKPVNNQRRLLKRGAPRRLREVHALKGISFTAYEGEAIGVVGRNGSGKSTLLRAIAGLLPPTEGAVYADGEPALLGVNAALINELSGERNIILGGLALGLSPAEVEKRYQEIVDFAGIGDFIELPMNTYSSGMAARLRFAIATITTQRILLVDEALATGDAEFRRKSEKRIAELRDHAGTVFLVSHSLGTVRDSCNRALWIDAGVLKMDGPVDDVVDAYVAATR